MRPSKKYRLFGPAGYRAKRRMWGYCMGDAFPSCRWESKWFATEAEALAWEAAEEPMPPDRLTYSEERIIKEAVRRIKGGRMNPVRVVSKYGTHYVTLADGNSCYDMVVVLDDAGKKVTDPAIIERVLKLAAYDRLTEGA